MARPKRTTAPSPTNSPSGATDPREAFCRSLERERRLYSVQEVSEVIGIKEDDVRVIFGEGFDCGERRFRIAPTSVAHWLRTRQVSKSSIAAFSANLLAGPNQLSEHEAAEVLGLHPDAFAFISSSGLRLLPGGQVATLDLWTWLMTHRYRGGDET